VTSHKLWLPLGLIFSAGIILIGVTLIFNGFIPQAKETTRPGWLVIRPPYDVQALAEQGDSLWAGGQDGLYHLDLGSGALIEKGGNRSDY